MSCAFAFALCAWAFRWASPRSGLGVSAWAPPRPYDVVVRPETPSRRTFLFTPVVLLLASTGGTTGAAAVPLPPSVAERTALLEQARTQLVKVPALLREEKWDAVRAVLLQPPVADLWAKASGVKNILPAYAAAVGDAGGDELAVLEAKEDIVSHLRYLDMAVYNNVFNPIAVEGTVGATKALLRSYYEDPINEYNACLRALDELIALGKGL
jgi:hypothetical protein|uniref:Uncharacterized protein n=1 Tax=Phaeodactylum tricornutum TaxID=2850 RepID=A0A8J9SYP9_PHATR